MKVGHFFRVVSDCQELANLAALSHGDAPEFVLVLFATKPLLKLGGETVFAFAIATSLLEYTLLTQCLSRGTPAAPPRICSDDVWSPTRRLT